MKRITFAAALLGLILCRPVMAADAEYINWGYQTNWPAIDAVKFLNYGTFTNLLNPLRTPIPFDTTDTLYFTNRGTMSGSVGFRFDTATATNRHAASTFFNHGTISGVDSAFDLFSPLFDFSFDLKTTPASYVLANATNLINDGTLSVGTVGLLRLTGKDVNLSHGALVAGDPADVNTNVFNTNNIFNNLNLGGGRGLNLGFGYINPPGVDDLYWGSTIKGSFPVIFLNQVDFFTGQPTPFTPPELVFLPASPLNFFNVSFVSLPINTNAIFQANLYAYSDFFSRTQKWVNIVFVNTNFTDTNIQANVRFDPSWVVWVTGTNIDFNAVEDVVQFGVPTYDVIHDRTITNAFYLLDTGAIVTPIVLETNLANPNSVARPSCFEITTSLPFEWLLGTNANTPYDPAYIYPGNYPGSLPGNQYKNLIVDYTSGSYGAQVGRNPESGDGLTSSPTNAFLTSPYLVLPDPTNQPGRIEINADRLNLSQARIRSEGLVSINCKHLTVGGTAGVDAGVINANLASTNGPLVITGVFPPHFKRCRGDIYAWSATWDNVETNAFETNTIHFHCLVVDHNLNADFTPTVRNLTLRSPTTNAVVVNDALRVIRKGLIDTENLTINSTVNFSEQVANLGPGNLPRLKNFLNDTNGYLIVDNEARFGFGGRALDSVINRGIISAVAPLFSASEVDNSGVILATNGGSVIIQADNLALGSANPINTTSVATLTNISCQLLADHDIILSANALTATNSAILAGRNGFGRLELEVTNNLTDTVPGIAGTSNVITNLWQTTDGIVMFTKPDSGDLFGTEIRTIADGFNRPEHIWAGRDPIDEEGNGNRTDGYFNNAVIGRLVLDRKTTQSAFHFSGPDFDHKYAMFVDYLDLEELAYDFYRDGLEIDDNFTIYFADSNADPVKLTNVFPNRLVWVSEFAGPNSSKLVQVPDGKGGTCDQLVNRSLAESPTIDTDLDGVNNLYDSSPFDNLICNADLGGKGFQMRTLVSTNSSTNYSLTLTLSGKGKVNPKLNAKNFQAGKLCTITAVPDVGNVFLGWSGSINSTNSKLSFLVQSNMVLQASFIPNPFSRLKGEYNGLFYETNSSGIRLESSGFFTFVVTEKGVLSGRLQMGGRTYPFHSQFDLAGHASATIKRSHLPNLILSLQLDVTVNQDDQVHGDVTDGTWDAVLLGDHNVFNPRRNPAPQAGRYTMVLPGSYDVSAAPGGDGFASVTINTSGLLHAKGQLADGTTFEQSVPVSKHGQWPFYASLYGGKGSLLSWVTFDSVGNINGNLNWIRSSFKGKYYAAGFTNDIALAGATYNTPPNRGLGLTLTNPVVTLSGGNLIQSLTNAVIFNSRNLSFSSTNNHLTLNVNAQAGLFTGRFNHPVTGAGTRMQGVLLQNENAARGFFLGTNESGAVRLGN